MKSQNSMKTCMTVLALLMMPGILAAQRKKEQIEILIHKVDSLNTVLEKERTAWVSDERGLRSTIDSLGLVLKGVQQDFEDCKVEKDDISAQLEQKKEEAEALEAQYASAVDSINALTIRIADLEEQLGSLSSNFIFTRNGVGGIEIGGSLSGANIASNWEKRIRNVDGEGFWGYELIDYYLEGELLLSVWRDFEGDGHGGFSYYKDKVIGIQLWSDRFKDGKGIGPGITVRSFIDSYGSMKVFCPYCVMDIYSMSIGEVNGCSYWINPTETVNSFDWFSEQGVYSESLNGDNKILSIEIGGCLTHN